MHELEQIFDTVNMGLVILDARLTVTHWNRWMELHSKLPSGYIVGTPLFEHFPSLQNSHFIRNCKSVLTFGSFSFFSQKLHKYLFPFAPTTALRGNFEYMQQHCTMGPLRNKDNSVDRIFLIVQDATKVVAYERQLIDMNIKDPLTGVYNRRYLDKRIKEEFERHRRHNRNMSIAMIDIDHFKKVNDTYGHQAGDYILKMVSSDLLGCIRSIDILSRFGGEEFCCVMPETDMPSAAIVAERFRSRVANAAYEFEDTTIVVTISIGLSTLTTAPSLKCLLKSADEALYDAKRGGRNRVVQSAGQPVPTTKGADDFV